MAGTAIKWQADRSFQLIAFPSYLFLLSCKLRHQGISRRRARGARKAVVLAKRGERAFAETVLARVVPTRVVFARDVFAGAVLARVLIRVCVAFAPPRAELVVLRVETEVAPTRRAPVRVDRELVEENFRVVAALEPVRIAEVVGRIRVVPERLITGVALRVAVLFAVVADRTAALAAAMRLRDATAESVRGVTLFMTTRRPAIGLVVRAAERARAETGLLAATRVEVARFATAGLVAAAFFTVTGLAAAAFLTVAGLADAAFLTVAGLVTVFALTGLFRTRFAATEATCGLAALSVAA